MRNPLSAFATRSHSKTALRSLPGSVVAIVAALSCTPLLAVEIDDVAKSNASSAPQAEIPWTSGGVGDDARDEMRKVATAYNILIVFSNRHGSYLAGIPFTVTGRNGREVLAGVSDGPLLYMKLPPAAYRISAQIDGTWQSKRILAGRPGHPERTIFVSRGD